MTQLLHSFFDNIFEQYCRAEQITEPFKRNGTFRGRQHSISSIAEDMFASLLHDTLVPQFPNIRLYFMVDYPMKPDMGTSRLFPDIAIIAEGKEPVLVSYLDLKTDLGYKRNYFDSYDLIKEQVIRLRQSDYSGTYTHPEKKPVRISPHLKWRTVVISDCNMSSVKLLEENKQRAIDFSDYFKLYFLSGKCHPNQKKRGKIDLYEGKPFQQLIDDIKQEIEMALPIITNKVAVLA